ncbi:MAG: SLBB domain-containing protein [Saprospiraceae bacterium]
MNKIFVFILFIVCFVPLHTYGQVPNLLNPQRAASSELARRGITEQELLDKLAEKGIYLDNIQNLTANEALQLQNSIQQAIDEIEAEKAGTTRNPGQFRASDTTVRPQPQRNTTQINDSTGEVELVPTDKVSPTEQPARKGDTIIYLPAAKTSKTSNTPSNLKSQPLDISNLVYGQEIFKNKSIQLYNKSENIKPPDTYVLGVGDILNIHIFGRSKADHKNLEINPQGYIQVGNFPRIYIKGLTYAQAKQIVRQNLSNYYLFESNEFEMTIDFSREIGVNIYGEAEQIGTFNIPATNTAINALVAAGGPNRIGSVRNIKLIRGKTVKNLDIYEFINNPSIAQDFYLEQNDIIHIPVAEKVISITGAIRRPMKYELVDGEDLMKLIQYAAGLREDAFLKMMQVKRFVDDKEQIIDIPYKELRDSKKDFLLLNGDVVTIRTIPLPIEQVVSIEGRVETPGTYQFIEGMKVLDLLDKGQVRRGAKTDIAFMMRLNEDGTYSLNRISVQDVLDNPTDSNNIVLKAQDRLLIYSLSSYTDQEFITAGGALRQSVRVAYDPKRNFRISDIILMGGGLTPDALDFGYIRRVNRENFVEKDYIQFNTKKAIANPGGADDPILEPNDDILLYSDRSFYDEAFVQVSGSVRRPGSFAYGPGFKLKDIIVLAGGFTREAATNRIEVFRVLIDENRPTKTVVATLTLRRGDLILDNDEGNYELQPFDQVQVRTVPDFELQQNVAITGEVLFPGTYALIKDNETIVDLLRRAGGPNNRAFLEGATLQRSEDNIGYIVFRLPEAVKNPNSWDNLILKQGDVLSIPKVLDFVRVEGQTDAVELYQDKLIGANNRINVAFVPNKNAKYYVDEFAAGVSNTGSRSRITVERPNGRIQKTKRFLIFNIYPKVEKGSIVRVGTKRAPSPRRERVTVDQNGVVRASPPKAKVNWSRVLADTMAQATSVLSFVLLVKTLNAK